LPFLFRLKGKFVAREEGRWAEKASAGKNRLGEPSLLPQKEAGLMIFPRNALPSGPGNAQNSIGAMPTWQKVKGGSLIFLDALPAPY
jgi:hypothetical protein